jgi:hypothetical protein
MPGRTGGPWVVYRGQARQHVGRRHAAIMASVARRPILEVRKPRANTTGLLLTTARPRITLDTLFPIQLAYELLFRYNWV